MTEFDIHIFVGTFDSEDSAMDYASAKYNDDDSVERQFAADIGARALDEDFFETIFGDERHEYLQSLLVSPEDINRIRSAENSTANTFFLIFAVEDHIDLTFDTNPKTVQFLGTYKGVWQ